MYLTALHPDALISHKSVRSVGVPRCWWQEREERSKGPDSMHHLDKLSQELD